MYRLIRITSDDYRRAYSRIAYSYMPRGQENPMLSNKVREMTVSRVIGEGGFLDMVENPDNEFYFLKSDDQIIGLTELNFSLKSCTITNFAVFEQGKGIGTILCQETKRVIQEHGIRNVELWCPFAGAQIFWKKMGFRNTRGDTFVGRVR